jgi:Tol biopolymer transport system component
MERGRLRWFFIVAIIFLMISCTIGQIGQSQQNNSASPGMMTPTRRPYVPWKGGTYQNADFSFEVPEGWQLTEGAIGSGKNAGNYLDMNFKVLVHLTTRSYTPNLTIASRELPAGSTFEQQFDETYAKISSYIRNVKDAEQRVVGELDALAIRYDRPLGEPWYSFQDTWVEDNGRIFLIACQFKLNPADADRKECESVLASLKFSDSGILTPTVGQATGEVELPEATEALADLPPGGCPENLGKLVFAYNPRDNSVANYDIYAANADGSGRTRLTENDVADMDPAWSPERCRIAFTSRLSGNEDDIFVMSAGGKSLQRLTNDPGRDMFPDWSPDGRQIAFISYRDGFRNLFVMDADGSNQRQLTFNKAEYTQWEEWSPKGDEIAFTYNPEGSDKGQNIFAIHPDGTGLRQVTPSIGRLGDYEPTWSPDGATIYFLSNRSSQIEIWKINADSSGLQQISNLYGANVSPSHSLKVSPDGKQLVFYGVGPGSEQHLDELYVIKVDGSGLKDLTQSPGSETWVDW